MPDLTDPVRVTLQLPLFLWVAVGFIFVVGALLDIADMWEKWRIGRERREFRRLDRKHRRQQRQEFRRQAKQVVDKADS